MRIVSLLLLVGCAAPTYSVLPQDGIFQVWWGGEKKKADVKVHEELVKLKRIIQRTGR